MTDGNVRGRLDNDYNDNGEGRGEGLLTGRPGGGMRDSIPVYEITEAARNLLLVQACSRETC